MKIENISKRYGDKVILDDASFHFIGSKRIGLVGVNGAGKSTLLNIMCGIEESDLGEVHIPKTETLGYLPQEPNPNPQISIIEECLSGHSVSFKLKADLTKLENEMATSSDPSLLDLYNSKETQYRNIGGYSKEAEARKILIGLGFEKSSLDHPPNTLSGGWRMRLELAKLFLLSPSIYILDEPTNHLDLPSMIFVEDFLKSSSSTTIFVSHDRGLLDRLSTDILHLKFGDLKNYPGNYTNFLKQEKIEKELLIKERASIESKISELQLFITRFGAKATKAKQAQSKAKQVERLRSQLNEIKIDVDNKKLKISLPKISKSHRDVLSASELSVGYAQPLIEKTSFLIERGDKVAVVGANGAGKSTLLKTLMNELEKISGDFIIGSSVNISYFAQNQADKLDTTKTVIENFLASSNMSEKEARSILGRFLFTGDDIFKQTGVLSGGEKNRLGLSIIFSSNSNFLILDEPTNHLDLDSIEALKNVIDEFEGTVLFVSHNQDFTNHAANKCLYLDRNKSLELHFGNLDSIEDLIKKDMIEVNSTPSTSNSSQRTNEKNDISIEASNADINISETDIREMQKRKKKLTKSIEKLELDISAVEENILNQEKIISTVSFDDYEKINAENSILEELTTKKDELELKYLDELEILETTTDSLTKLGRN